MGDFAGLLAAASYAAVQHRGQFRKGKSRAPYINHPLEVAGELAGAGVEEVDVLIAALPWSPACAARMRPSSGNSTRRWRWRGA